MENCDSNSIFSMLVLSDINLEFKVPSWEIENCVVKGTLEFSDLCIWRDGESVCYMQIFDERIEMYMEIIGIQKNKNVSDTEVIAGLKSFLLKKADELFESAGARVELQLDDVQMLGKK